MKLLRSVANHLRIFRNAEGGGSGGGTPAPLAPAFDSAMLANIPGAEMLQGATTIDTAPASEEEDDDDDEDEAGEGIGAVTETPAKKDEEEEEKEEKEEKPAAPEVAAITKERDELKVKLEAAEKERDELKSKAPVPAPAPTAEAPLADVFDANTLAAHQTFAEELEEWAIDNGHQGGTMPAKLDAVVTGRTLEEATAEPREFTAEEAKGMRKIASQRIRKDIPARQQWLQTDAQAERYVQTHYPDALKPETETGKLYAQFERQFPAIKALPTWRVALLDCVRGAQQRIAEEQKRQGKKPEETTPSGGKPKAGEETPLAPVPPGKPGGTGAKPAAGKPQRGVPLKAHMDANDLASVL